MNDIEQKLLLYDDLPPSEQEEVARYVEQHPEWAPLLAEARALHALLRTGRADATPDATTVAAYVVARALGGPATPEQAARHARVADALAEDAALERQSREMAQALEQLAAEAEDPLVQFERLTGRRLGQAPAAPERAAPRVLPWTAVRPLRLALAACLALGVLYGALALASRLAQPERALLADLGDLPGDYGGLHLRGDAPADRTADRYALALDALAEARSSFLGLFPTYDEAGLDTAAARLREVVDTSGPDSWEGLEALYALGKIRLYRGQDEEAIWALQSVVALEGPHAADARRLLDYLQHAGGAAE
jgi:hypothetical protein